MAEAGKTGRLPRQGGLGRSGRKFGASTIRLVPEDPAREEPFNQAFATLRDAAMAARDTYGLSDDELKNVLRIVMLTAVRQPRLVHLPDSAPELWAARDLNLRENAPQFIRRVYAQWLGKGLARKDLSRLDDDLYRALAVWLSRHPEDEIARLLPTQSDQLDELVDRLTAEYPVELLRKLGYAIDNRLRRQQRSGDKD